MSNLELLNEVAENAVARQIEDPGHFMVQDPLLRTRVAGIDVADPVKLAERKIRLENYQADAAMLRQKLDDAGVTYLALMPKTAWTNLAHESDLFRFIPENDGSVPADSTLLDKIGVSALRTLGIRCLMGLCVGALLGLILAVGATLLFHLSMIIGGALGVFLSILGAYGVGTAVRARYYVKSTPNPSVIRRLEMSAIRKALSAPRDQLLRTLWPSSFEPSADSVRIKIGLPPAPADAQANLIRASNANLALTLYAVGDAIRFEEDPVVAFIRTRESHWGAVAVAHAQASAQAERERERRAADNARYWQNLLSDPIVTVDLESATAIIVQYGDFPIEREVIERIFDSQRLI